MAKNIPLQLLNEAVEHKISVELSSGEVYYGTLERAEDVMNLQLRNVSATARNGQVRHMDTVYVRGSHVNMVVFPEMLQYAPVFHQDLLKKSQAQAKAAGHAHSSKPHQKKRTQNFRAPAASS